MKGSSYVLAECADFVSEVERQPISKVTFLQGDKPIMQSELCFIVRKDSFSHTDEKNYTTHYYVTSMSMGMDTKSVVNSYNDIDTAQDHLARLILLASKVTGSDNYVLETSRRKEKVVIRPKEVVYAPF